MVFSNEEFAPISRTLQIVVKQTFQTEANQIKRLFPNYNAPLVPTKIQEVIAGISDGYMRHPILCMIALRTLIEICLREFRNRFDTPGKENFDDTTIGLLSRYHTTLNMAFAPTCAVPQEIQDKYKGHLSGKAKNKLCEQLQELDLNTYVHNPAVNTTSSEVLSSLRTFKNLISYIIDSLAI